MTKNNHPVKRSMAKNLCLSIAALTFLAACQASNTGDVLSVDGSGDDTITAADLRAYCPTVVLREGTANIQNYTKGNDDNSDELIYQASISDVTRTCKYRSGQLLMTVVAAGRVVTGPKGSMGTIELPIRVAITQGADNPYSRLGRLPVTIASTAGATQFVYNDSQIILPEPPERNLTVYVGFDEGPYDTP